MPEKFTKKDGQEKMNKPEWAKDAIFHRTEVFLSRWERIKILFGYGLIIDGRLYTENLPGKTEGDSEVRIFSKWKKKSVPQTGTEKKL